MRFCRTVFILGMLCVGGVIALGVAKLPGALTIGVIAFIAMQFAKKGYQRLSACGTARWAEADDLEREGMLSGESGLIVGRMSVPRPGFFQGLRSLFDSRIRAAVACERFMSSMRKLPPPMALVRLAKAVHILVTAPTGAGKGVSFIIQFLRNCMESMVIVDVKGENYKLTAAARRAMGHKIVVLDPYKVVTQTPDQFNSLDEIEADSPLLIDDCRSLAEAFVIRTGEEKDMHWADSAELWISAMAMAVTQFGEAGNRSLQTIRTLLTDPTKMEAVIKMMCTSEACSGMIARAGHQLTRYQGTELGGVMTTTNRFLRFLDTLAIAESTKASSFDPKELRKGKMTVYLVLPPEHMRTQSPLLRMWIGAMLRAVVRGGLQEKNKVHFILDEAASLGHMEALDDAVDKYRGYGIRLQFYFQSLGQLKKSFPNGQDQTLLANTTQVYFGVNDHETAEYVSNRLGEATIIVDSGGRNTGESRQTTEERKGTYGTSRGSSENWQQQARKLLKPEEVSGLSPRTAITFTPGVPPLMTTLVPYYEEPKLGEPPWRSKKTRLVIWQQAISILLLTAATLAWLMVM
jgi:type IV secretion system protein VirD4